MNNNSLNITDLIKGFRLSCQTEGKSPKTTEWYTCFLARFNEFLQVSQMPTNASQIDKHHVRAFIRYLQTEARVPRTNRSLSPATVQGYVRTLKSFLSWLKREGYVATNVMSGIPIPKAPIKVIHTFTTEQIGRLADPEITLEDFFVSLDGGVSFYRANQERDVNVGQPPSENRIPAPSRQ